jgi:nucleoside 2-deoxyribosyltransferase
MKPTVYLSGPITGLTYEGCTDWRAFARQWLADLGIDGLCPMRGKEYLAGKGVILDGSSAVVSNFMSQDKAIVTRDRWDTTRCDFVLMNLLGAKSVSIGTMIELAWADAARVPVVLVIEPTGNIHEHAFVRELSGYRADTLEAGLDLVAAAIGRRAA